MEPSASSDTLWNKEEIIDGNGSDVEDEDEQPVEMTNRQNNPGTTPASALDVDADDEGNKEASNENTIEILDDDDDNSDVSNNDSNTNNSVSDNNDGDTGDGGDSEGCVYPGVNVASTTERMTAEPTISIVQFCCLGRHDRYWQL